MAHIGPVTNILGSSPLAQGPVISVLLVDDEPIVAEAIRNMLRDRKDVILHHCASPSDAIRMAAEVNPAVILQDLVMPDIDGLMLVRYFRANPGTREIPLVVLSSKDDPAIKAAAFEAGANDYIVKLPDKIELVARIRYHSAAYNLLLEKNLAFQKLEENQKNLYSELAEAAAYVKSILPKPLMGEITTSWRFIPSAQLGGDAFDYHWIDDDHFVFYLFDVCGHGVGAALLSISIMNVLRGHTLANTNFLDPAQVLSSLNSHFQMEFHNNMFFTIWYGVYDKSKRQITYASGGHPPAIMVNREDNGIKKISELRIPGLVIGAMPDVQFRTAVCSIRPNSCLYLFSDGLYELTKPDGTILQLEDFVTEFGKPSEEGVDEIDRILFFSKSVNRSKFFSDDVTLLEIIFN